MLSHRLTSIIREMQASTSKIYSNVRLLEFFTHFGIELSPEEFQALSRRCFAKNPSTINYKELMKLFSPF